MILNKSDKSLANSASVHVHKPHNIQVDLKAIALDTKTKKSKQMSSLTCEVFNIKASPPSVQQ